LPPYQLLNALDNMDTSCGHRFCLVLVSYEHMDWMPYLTPWIMLPRLWMRAAPGCWTTRGLLLSAGSDPRLNLGFMVLLPTLWFAALPPLTAGFFWFCLLVFRFIGYAHFCCLAHSGLLVLTPCCLLPLPGLVFAPSYGCLMGLWMLLPFAVLALTLTRAARLACRFLPAPARRAWIRFT